MSAYYNEHDAAKAAWLRELIRTGEIMDGEVDERGIEDVQPEDVRGFVRCHFFAGIGGWDLALRLAGWPAERPVWTGSCPCPPFSSANVKRRTGVSDERHLWPVWRTLIAQCCPATIFGEQVPSRDWLDRVSMGLEDLGYGFGAVLLPAHAFGFDHARERIYFAGYADRNSQSELPLDAKVAGDERPRGFAGGVVPPHGLPRRLALSGFGNAIVPQVAAEVIRATMDGVGYAR